MRTEINAVQQSKIKAKTVQAQLELIARYMDNYIHTKDVNWTHLADLSHISDLLQNVINFLNIKEEDYDDKQLKSKIINKWNNKN